MFGKSTKLSNYLEKKYRIVLKYAVNYLVSSLWLWNLLIQMKTISTSKTKFKKKTVRWKNVHAYWESAGKLWYNLGKLMKNRMDLIWNKYEKNTDCAQTARNCTILMLWNVEILLSAEHNILILMWE